MITDPAELARAIDTPLMHAVGAAADGMERECYAVGGYVRDLMLSRPSADVDFVTVGSGIELAAAVGRSLRATMGRKVSLSTFKSFGTARVAAPGIELEFVGARRESYRADSRNPIVEDGTMADDLARRDFTINAMALCVNASRFGELIDRYNGIADMESRIIRTPLDPDITFSDDPLRMMRAIRFATQLGFDIYPDTLSAIARNAGRITIITAERITDELMKIMASPRPSVGWALLDSTGLLPHILPELAAMKGVDTVRGRAHKDNFLHTLEVLDNVAAASTDIWLRWAALLHDIAKPVTKRWDNAAGWTFHNHNFIGSKMVPRIFRRLKLPMGEPAHRVASLVELHMRPIALVEDEVTDSAVRRMIHDAGADLDALMTLCRADITSKNREKVRRHLENFDRVLRKIEEVEARDHVRCFQPPVDGLEIMELYGLAPSREVGELKSAIKDAILDGVIPNEREAALAFLAERAAAMGLTQTKPTSGSPSKNVEQSE